MLAAGRRVALLEEVSIAAIPTDVVGRIYTSVDVDHQGEVEDAMQAW